MSKDNITEPVNTWDNFYQSRVCNDSYVNVFCKKYNRFIEEIIINIQQISYDLKAPPYLKGGRMWNRYCKPCYFANRREVV